MQILADSSIWMDYLRHKDAMLQLFIDDGTLCIHPFIIGEIALGHLNPRARILFDIDQLPKIMQVEDHEALALIEKHKLFGTDIGYIDVHLLASALISSAALWTRDKALHAAAEKLGIAAQIHYS